MPGHARQYLLSNRLLLMLVCMHHQRSSSRGCICGWTYAWQMRAAQSKAALLPCDIRISAYKFPALIDCKVLYRKHQPLIGPERGLQEAVVCVRSLEAKDVVLAQSGRCQLLRLEANIRFVTGGKL